MNFHIHTDIKHKTILRAMLIFASILLMMKLSVFSTDVKAEENIDYITTRAELMKALSDKQEVSVFLPIGPPYMTHANIALGSYSYIHT